MKSKYLVERDKNHRGQAYLSGPVLVLRNVSFSKAIRFINRRSDDAHCFYVRRLLDNATLSYNKITNKLNNYWISVDGKELKMNSFQIKFQRVLVGIAEVDLDCENAEEVKEELQSDPHLENDIIQYADWEHENTRVIEVEEI